MLTVGDRFPEFTMDACVAMDPAATHPVVTRQTFPGKWLVVFWYPADYTFVCPTEIMAFADKAADFEARDAKVLGASHDNVHTHAAWRRSDSRLHHVPFPILADPRRRLSSYLGIVAPDDLPMRATFLVDPEGVIQYVGVYHPLVGRNVDEVLRVLDALQTGELCPCHWKPGDATLVG